MFVSFENVVITLSIEETGTEMAWQRFSFHVWGNCRRIPLFLSIEVWFRAKGRSHWWNRINGGGGGVSITL